MRDDVRRESLVLSVCVSDDNLTSVIDLELRSPEASP